MKGKPNAALPILVAMTVSMLLLSPLQPSRAAASYIIRPTEPDVGATCASLGGSWDGSSTCTLGSDLSLATGDSVLVELGAVLAVPEGVTLADSGSVVVDGGVLRISGVLEVAAGGAVDDNGTVINAGGSVTNSGTIDAYVFNGTMTNDGSFTNEPGAIISIQHEGRLPSTSGSFNFTDDGTIDNLGSLTSFGNFTIGTKATVDNVANITLASATVNKGRYSAPVTLNAGTLTNGAGGTLIVDGATLNNTGSITNAGSITQEQGVFSAFNNLGNVTSDGSIDNYGFILNTADGLFVNSGTVDNQVGCLVLTCGSISNLGLMVNKAGGHIVNQGDFGNDNLNLRRPELGNFTNYGVMTNMDDFVNQLGGTATNFGVLDSSGSISNLGAINNLGSINSSGSILNSGYINNNASIINSRTITNSGSIANAGTLTNACQGIIDGTGTLSGNPVASAPCASSSSTTSTPEFPTEVLVPLLLSLLALVSLLANRKSGGAFAPTGRR